MSFTHLILNASVPVQLVMLALLLASLVSWGLIVRKSILLSGLKRGTDKFERNFWAGGRLNDIYNAVRRGRHEAGLESLFLAGYEELQQARNAEWDSRSEIVGAVQRALRVAQMREVDRIERGLAVLATIGSTSPYVGLFGTVWGIMNAFIGLGNAKHATLAMVAPGIAEALIATAIGLVAAIPAVIAYNTFVSKLDRLDSRFQAFSEEFLGIVERGVQTQAQD